jgi:hypothetical protein
LSFTWWYPLLDGGAKITSYKIVYGIIDEEPKSISIDQTVEDVLEATLTGLENGQIYEIHIEACNYVGCSDSQSGFQEFKVGRAPDSV